jgi:hypothetical protein
MRNPDEDYGYEMARQKEVDASWMFSKDLVGSDRMPAKFARQSPRPDLPFEEDKPEPWPYMWEAVIWTALLVMIVWGLVEMWK